MERRGLDQAARELQSGLDIPLVRARLRVAGRPVAGVGLAPARIDEDSIKAWGAWCAAQGLRCDAVLDRAFSHAEVLTLIARCGRASMTWQTGRLGAIWDGAGRPATALVTPGNIVAGSFRVDYAAGQAADEIAVRYIEPDLDWQYNTLRRAVPGAGTHPAATATITLHGVTDRNQAAVACNLQAARQLYHRRRLGWEMAAEGLAIARGDVVTITHSLIDGGAAGRLAGGTAARVRLDRPVNPGAGAHLLLRLLDGTVHQTAAAAPAGVQGETAELELADPLPLAPGADGDNPRDILWRLYDDALPPVRARIVAVRPSSERRVRFTAIDEVQAYHDAATADLSVPLPPLRVRTPRVLAIAFAETLVRVGAGFAVEIAAVLTVAGDWRGGVVRAAIDGEAPRTVARLVDGETTARWLAQPFGTLRVTVSPGTEAAPAGPSFAATYRIAGTLAPPGAPGNFLIDLLGDGTRRFRWTPPDDIDLAGILIRYAVDEGDSAPLWEDMTPLHRGFLTASPLETVEPAPGIYVFAARSIDTGGRLSTGDVRIRATLGPQRQGDALLWRCPSGSGWRGTATNAERSHDGLDALEVLGDYTWDDLTTWDAWQTWATGNGAGAGGEIGYAGEIVDLGGVLDVGLRWSADTVGEVAFEVRTGATLGALEAAGWAAHEPATTVSARWLQLRWRLTGDGSQVLSLDHLCWSVHAPGAVRKLLDRDTAEWEGTAAQGRIVPHDLGLVTDLDVTCNRWAPAGPGPCSPRTTRRASASTTAPAMPPTPWSISSCGASKHRHRRRPCPGPSTISPPPASIPAETARPARSSSSCSNASRPSSQRAVRRTASPPSTPAAACPMPSSGGASRTAWHRSTRPAACHPPSSRRRPRRRSRCRPAPSPCGPAETRRRAAGSTATAAPSAAPPMPRSSPSSAPPTAPATARPPSMCPTCPPASRSRGAQAAIGASAAARRSTGSLSPRCPRTPTSRRHPLRRPERQPQQDHRHRRDRDHRRRQQQLRRAQRRRRPGPQQHAALLRHQLHHQVVSRAGCAARRPVASCRPRRGASAREGAMAAKRRQRASERATGAAARAALAGA